MCGLAGIVRGGEAPLRIDVLKRMGARLKHRGPDDCGEWSNGTVGLTHRRLSIIDLSSGGHQPMTSFCGRYVTAYNGEIYNYRQLRRELDSVNNRVEWRGGSDTEVFLAAISTWGIEKTLRKIDGMFAAAVFDQRDGIVFLMRDRFGEKPLYYGGLGDDLVFTSELKALREHPRFTNEINQDALCSYIQFGYIAAPLCIFKGLYKLEPGHFATITVGRTIRSEDIPVEGYWRVEDVVRNAVPQTLSPEEAVEEVDRLLRESVARRMVADVPVGAFLSGGIDSSAVVATMQSLRAGRVNTFTIGFHEDAYDEARDARNVARYLDTNHTELYVTSKDALETVPGIPAVFDEPFADHSQIPTLIISKLARTEVKVALTGDAGDEIFGGYSRYLWAPEIWNRIKRLPGPLRTGLAQALLAVSPRLWDKGWNLGSRFQPRWFKQRLPGEKLHKLARVLDAKSLIEVYLRLLTHWQDPAQVLLDDKCTNAGGRGAPFEEVDGRFVEAMMYWDTKGYLPDDILVKVDRASMSNSLETRIPFLEPKLFELMWRLPAEMKIRNGETKWLLRKIVRRHLPDELVDRPKMGFSLPLAEWLRGPLREWSGDLLQRDRIEADGFFRYPVIEKTWHEHLTRRRDHQYALWNVLMFQAWREEYL